MLVTVYFTCVFVNCLRTGTFEDMLFPLFLPRFVDGDTLGCLRIGSSTNRDVGESGYLRLGYICEQTRNQLSRIYTKRANTRRNFAEFSRELLLHNYTLVSMKAVYINSESSPSIRRELAERKIICKMLQELAQIVLAATISLSTAVDTCIFVENVFVMFENPLLPVCSTPKNCKSSRKTVWTVKRDGFGEIAKRKDTNTRASNC